MAEIRLNKLIKQFSIGLDALVDFLNTQGMYPPRHPNAKVPDTVLPALHKKFGRDKEIAEEAAKVPVRISTILGETKGKRKISIEPTKVVRPIERKPIVTPINKQIGPSDVVSDRKRAYGVRIKSINRPNRIITEAFREFEIGVLFPKDIIFRGKPVSMPLAEAYIARKFHVGDTIHCHIIDTSPNGKVAFLSYEIHASAFYGMQAFESLKPGAKYPVKLEGTTPNYFQVSIVDTWINGMVLKDQFAEGAVFDKRGNIQLQLVEKTESPYQMVRFVKPIASQKRAEVGNLDDLVKSFLTPAEMDVITPEDLDVVRDILNRFPNLKREKADQITGIQLYCRVPDGSPMYYFIKQEPNYCSKHSFWVSVNLDDEQEPSIALFTESPTIVIEIKAYSDDVFTVAQFDFRKTGFTKNILQKYNKRTRLKVSGGNLRFVTKYDPVPPEYNTEEIINYLGNLYEFNSNIVPGIRDAIREKTLISAKDYSILSSFLRYQQSKELEKEDGYIFVPPVRITTSSGFRIGDNVALRLRLYDYEAQSLYGTSENNDGPLHVAIVNEESEELLTGYMDASSDDFILHFNHGYVDLSDFLSKGIRLRCRASIRHLLIQRDAIENFIHQDSLDIYQDLINNRLETPDMALAEDIEYKNPLFYTTAGDNTQSEAVKKALGNKSVLLIQGPPGTGKTTIIVEIIEQLVARGKKVLVCSQAHAAVKNIYDRLHSRCPEMDLLTLDEKDEITTAARNFDDEDYIQFLRNNLSVLGTYRRGGSKEEVDAIIDSLTYKTTERTADFRKKHHHVIDYREVISSIPPQSITFLLDRLKIDSRSLDVDLLKAQIYREKDVILGTCIGIGMDPVLRDKDAVHFDTVIVDEAGKANLAETIVPLQLGDRFILVGDHRQLPPYFDREEIEDYRDSARNNAYAQNYSQQDVEKAMNKSLFSDFFDHPNFPDANKVTLNYQFRMNPQIGQYISDLFYAGQLYSGEGTEKQTVTIEGYADPVTFVDTFVYNITEDNDPFETKSPDGSVFNMREVKDICEKVLPNVAVALDSNPELTCGIITPYKAQYRKLREALRDSRFNDSVYTIDSIQGSEFDIVVFSFVRAFSSRSNKTVGFLDDLRRLNVSLSRAKKKLILVGHLPTLKNPASHIETSIPGMVSPVEVFSSIASRIKRYGELSPIERFVNLGYEQGNIFNDCEFHDDGQKYVVIHLDGFDLASRVSPKGFYNYEDGDLVDIILSGFDATGRPLFDSADLYKFLQSHADDSTYDGMITKIYQKQDGGMTVYVTVDGYQDRLDIAPFLKDKHPEYYVEGTILSVEIDRYKDEPDRIFFRPHFSEAEQLKSDGRSYVFFKASVKEIKTFPMVVFEFKDKSEITLPCPILWHTAVADEYYDLIKFSNGDCKLHNHYMEDFLNTHKKGVPYKGLVVSEDKEYYYVEVDEYCGVVEKARTWKRGVKIDGEYTVEVSGVNNYNKFVYFKFV